MKGDFMSSERKTDPVREVIYGPVNSRRLGKSLGLNLMPSRIKVCPFDCVYCHCGWSEDVTLDINKYIHLLPSAKDIKKALEKKLNELKKDNFPLNYITFSGNGEASLHPDFPEIADTVKRLRDIYYPESKTCILSNSSTLHLPHSLEGIKKLDRKVMKLDGGSEEIFRSVNRPAEGVLFEKVVECLRELRNFSLQTNFFTGSVSNSEKASVTGWIETVKYIKPEEILLYTVARPTSDGGIKKIPKETLEAIGKLAEKETGIKTYVY